VAAVAVAAADLSYPLAFVCRGADLSAEAESHAAEHKCHINCFKLLSSTQRRRRRQRLLYKYLRSFSSGKIMTHSRQIEKEREVITLENINEYLSNLLEIK